jgi:hypothetical protein
VTVWKTHISVGVEVLTEDRLERRGVEGRVTGLQDNRIAGSGRDGGDQLACLSFLDRAPDEGGGIGVPRAAVVVCVDNGETGRPRLANHVQERLVPPAVGLEQAIAVLVEKVLDDVDEEERRGHEAYVPGSRRPQTAGT